MNCECGVTVSNLKTHMMTTKHKNNMTTLKRLAISKEYCKIKQNLDMRDCYCGARIRHKMKHQHFLTKAHIKYEKENPNDDYYSWFMVIQKQDGTIINKSNRHDLNDLKKKTKEILDTTN